MLRIKMKFKMQPEIILQEKEIKDTIYLNVY